MPARHQPPSGVGARATLATAAIMAGTLVAHSWAGGSLPSAPYLAGVTALVLGASTAVFRGVVSGPAMFVALGAAQFGLHGVLMFLAGAGSHAAGAQVHAGHAMTGGHSVLDLFSMDPRMAAAHTVSAALTALMWSVVAQALDVLVRLPEQVGVGVGGQMRTGGRDADPVVIRSPWLTGAPRRGPPYAALPRCA